MFALIVAGLASYVVNLCGRLKKAPLPVSIKYVTVRYRQGACHRHTAPA